MKKLFLTIGFAAGTLMLAAQPQVVAHRGFHAAEGSWENTVSSLRNAQKLGIYDVEFDVNMTADDSLIVYHGPKILDTKLHAQKNRFAEIRAVKLPGGLEIPTLREFFAQGQKGPSTKLILEIKKHATPQRETQVVEAILRTEQMISPPASSIDRESDCGVKSQTSHKTQCRKDSKRIILKTKTNVFVTPRAEPDSFGRSRGGKTTE